MCKAKETFMCIENLNKFDWSLFFDGITAFGTVGALVFAIIIARNISFRRDLRKKQLDTVFDLVAQLQELHLYFSFRLNEMANGQLVASNNGDTYYGFFNMTKKKFQEIESFKGSSPTIYVSEKFLYDNPIFKFVNNPFLPPEIATRLINLYPRGGDQTQYNLADDTVFISDDRKYQEHTYRKEISQYYTSLERLFIATESLNESIKNWLRDNEADDLNFRDKPINYTNYP
jgi:hypothetical protein